MKAFIAVKDDSGIQSQIDNRFGRAGYFIIYDMVEDKIISSQPNAFKEMDHGVGVEVAQQVIKQGCQLAIGARPGPKAAEVLQAGGIEFFLTKNCNVQESIEKYRKIQP